MSSTRNIVLVGFMGTGKSTVGKILAQTLSRTFLDMDAIIEERQGRSIPQIFAQEGEPYFRKLERALVQELAARENLVIAPGGGIVLNAANLADFSKSGLVVCLTASPNSILKRVEHDTNRPLLQGGDKLQKITDLLNRRRLLYDAIPHQIPTDGLAPDAIAEHVLKLFKSA